MEYSTVYGCCCGLVLVMLCPGVLMGDIKDRVPQASSVSIGHGGSTVYEFEEICETESFNASCDAGEVILITQARYGRMIVGRCVKLNYGHVGCASNVTDVADGRCSGRQHCEIRIPDNSFARTKPCPDDLKPYLEIGYSCLKVHSVETMCNVPGPILLSSSEGYLANLVTENTGCGGQHNPWVINAKPGQVINIKLYDFSVARRKDREDSSPFPQCQMYAMIREKLPSSASRNITVCGGTVREKTVYSSAGHSVEVTIMPDTSALLMGKTEEPDRGTYFVLKYEVSGCADIISPAHSSASRSGDSLTVKCNFSNEMFHLKCVGSEWVGEVGNCSKAPLLKHSKIEYEEIHIPYGMSIMIVIVIALVIGLFVLTIGLLFLKKRTDHENSRSSADAEKSRLRQKGFCQPRALPEEDIYVSQRDEGEKEYVRTPWQTQTASQGSLHSFKNVPTWPRESDYPTFGTELPPCTPLMDRFHKPPLYGQLGSKLPCGCPTYMTRGEVQQQQQQEAAESSPQHRSTVTVNPSNPDQVQYFIVEQPDMVQGSANHAVITTQNNVPRAPPTVQQHGQQQPQQQQGGNNHITTSTFKPAPVPAAPPTPISRITTTGATTTTHPPASGQQTDEIKLRLRQTDTGLPTVQENYKAQFKDRLQNASNDRLECITRDTTNDTEL